MGQTRLIELVKKSAAGTLTEVEKAEMVTLTNRPETMKKSVTFAEFSEFANSELAALAVKPDEFKAALLKANSEAAVKATATDPAGKFEIEVVKDAAKVDSSVQYASIIDGLTKIQTSIDALKTAGTPDVDVKKAAGMVGQLAGEVMTSLSTKMLTLKGLVDAGTVTKENVETAFSGMWQAQNFVDMAVTTIAKRDNVPEADLKKASEAILPVVETKAAPTVCPECGADMAGATTCPKCGWKYDAAAEAKAKEEKAKKAAEEEAVKKAAEDALNKRGEVFPMDIGAHLVEKAALEKAAAEKDKK